MPRSLRKTSGGKLQYLLGLHCREEGCLPLGCSAKSNGMGFAKLKAMRAIWKGSISFGLVSIPVSLYPAVKREELKFRLLRKSDLSPVNYKRVAEADGKEVAWEEIVKGYEYEKGKFVVFKDEDFERVDIEATQTVDITHFVKLEEINPLLFHKPYHMEVAKGGQKAYLLLRDALKASGKIAVSKVVIKTRQYLAAVKPQGKILMLELMYFPDELVDSSKLESAEGAHAGKQEMAMASQLIEGMTKKWDPRDYQDEYRAAIEKLIDEKIRKGDKALPKAEKRKMPSNVIDLVSVLKKSIQETRGKTHDKPKHGRRRKVA